MILDVDIGNTALKWRLVGTERRGRALLGDWGRLTDDLAQLSLTRVRVSCVAGSTAETQFSDWCIRKLGITPEFARVLAVHAGLVAGYHQPQVLGVDRWLAMLAAKQQVNGAYVVIDAGSAITADFVDGAGVHQGGLILPGVQLMVEALFRNTSAVKLAALTLPQNWMPGRDTLSCVENGVAAAVAGLAGEIVRYGKNHLSESLAYLVCGGDADAIAPHCPNGRVYPDLVMDGLEVALDFHAR